MFKTVRVCSFCYLKKPCLKCLTSLSTLNTPMHYIYGIQPRIFFVLFQLQTNSPCFEFAETRERLPVI